MQQDSLILSSQALFLSLISLIGTFFYVHLSNWYRAINDIKNKWELNDDGDSQMNYQAQLECRYSLPGLYNWVPATISAAITFFILVVYYFSASLWNSFAGPELVKTNVTRVGFVFLILYLILTTIFLLGGYRTGYYVQKQIKAKYPETSTLLQDH